MVIFHSYVSLPEGKCSTHDNKKSRPIHCIRADSWGHSGYPQSPAQVPRVSRPLDFCWERTSGRQETFQTFLWWYLFPNLVFWGLSYFSPLCPFSLEHVLAGYPKEGHTNMIYHDLSQEPPSPPAWKTAATPIFNSAAFPLSHSSNFPTSFTSFSMFSLF